MNITLPNLPAPQTDTISTSKFVYNGVINVHKRFSFVILVGDINVIGEVSKRIKRTREG